jgi:hypothetical protein
MLESVGRWFRDSLDRANSTVQGAGDRLGDLSKGAGGAAREAARGAADAARGAAGAVVRLPNARVISGRERCAMAPNGAPDCRAAAEAVCRGKGFASGSSLDMQSAQKCSVRAWLSGRSAEPGECQIETFVTRAMCQ